MKVTVGGWAWFNKADLTPQNIASLKAALTVKRRKVGDHPGEPPGPLHLWLDEADRFGIPREFFLKHRRPAHETTLDVTSGDKTRWPGDLQFNGTLRAEQQRGLDTVMQAYERDALGGLVQAVPGWGKTVFACSVMHALQVPTLVIVHKEFLLNQWKDRISTFLPNAKVGIVQGEQFEWGDTHVSIGMVHSLGGKEYPQEFWDWPGLVITDECHRIGADTWAPVNPMFRARYRLGLSATPRRKDGAEAAFQYHIGRLLFASKEQRMTPKIRRVWTTFQLIKTPKFNPGLASKNLILRFLTASRSRNEQIIDQLLLAVKADRKVIVLSERLQHLHDLETILRAKWNLADGAVPTSGYYVGGMKEEELASSAQARIIFATSQFVAEGLDIPALDTLFFTTPLSDIEQAVGRILRPHDGKKEPVVVDFRDDEVTLCKRLGDYRDKQYTQLGWT